MSSASLPPAAPGASSTRTSSSSRLSSKSSLRSAGGLMLEPGSPTTTVSTTATEPDTPVSSPKRNSKVKFSGSGAGGVDKAASDIPSLKEIRDKQDNGRSASRPTSSNSTSGKESPVPKMKGFFAKKQTPEKSSSPPLTPPSPSSPKSARTDDIIKRYPQAQGRRRSLPCLKVNTQKKGEESFAGPRRVSFGGNSAPHTEMFEAFTPYCKKYGAHPSEFYFDAEGHMVLEEDFGDDDDGGLSKVKVGDTLECSVDCGVGYRRKPQMTARFEDLRTVEVAQQIKVLQACGGWVRDSVGWLPLKIKENPVFEIVVPKEKLTYLSSRVAVLASSVDESAKAGA